MAHAVGDKLRKYKPSMIRRLHKEYVTSPEQPTLQNLSDKYDVKMSYLKWKSSTEHWVQERQNYIANQLNPPNPNDNGNDKCKSSKDSEVSEREALAQYARRLLMVSLPVLVKKAEAGNVPTANQLASIGTLYERLTKHEAEAGEGTKVYEIYNQQEKPQERPAVQCGLSGSGEDSKDVV